MDSPPSTPRSSRAARRTLLTTAAALSALAAPVGLVAGTLGGSEGLEVERIASTEDAVRAQDASQAVPFVITRVDELDRLRELITPPPTTAPPAPTTTTTVRPAPAAARTAAAPAPARKGADPNDPATWDRLAQCESGGNWAINTGNGYYGGLQFSARTWRSVGGTGLPHQHSRETQIEMGKRLQARAGWGQWPACTRRLGYR